MEISIFNSIVIQFLEVLFILPLFLVGIIFLFRLVLPEFHNLSNTIN